MRFSFSIACRNIRRRPVRAVLMCIIILLLSFTAFIGGYLIISLQNGLDGYRARLGADIVVIPSSAQGHGTVDNVLLQGITGNYYIPQESLKKLEGIEGIEKKAGQFYLTSAKASCCSARVQIIGFDPETDFSIQPWVEKSYSNDLGLYDAVVGSNVTPNTDMTVEIYGKTLRVQAVLDKTGTELDSALYVDIDTMKELIRAHNEKNPNQEKTIDPDSVVSSVLIKVADGYDIDDVVADINLHAR